MRQLNMYSFRKVKNGGRPQEFFHPHFKRGAFDELGLIQRKKVLPKGLRPHRYENVKETNQKLELLQQKLEDLLDQNRLLITTNKRFMSKISNKNKDCAIKERKLLFMCLLMGLKVCKPDEIKNTLKTYDIKTPEYDSEIFDSVLQCYRRSISTENEDPDFIDDLLHTIVDQANSENKNSKSLGFKIKNILEKSHVDSEMPQNVIVPKTAFAFHFPKKRSASNRSEHSESFRDNRNLLDLSENMDDNLAQKLASPVYSGYRFGLSGDEYLEEPSGYRNKEITS